MFSSNKRSPPSGQSDDTPRGPPKKRYRHHIADDESTSKNEDSDLINSQRTSSTDDQQQQQAEKGKAWQMMAKMGYKEGGGLGAQNQGRSEPIDVKLRSRRRGLGAEIKGFEPSLEVSWNEEQESITVEETAEWIPECPLDVPTEEELDGWIKIGPKRLVIDEETQFCDPAILADMLKSKSVFDELNDRDLRNARARANPFETIKGGFFQNRAAMKMANLDAVFDDLFTNPKTASDKLWVPKDGDELLYFADVCAGPGGFTEYFLWRRGWSSHGFGLTLKGKDDFRLDDFLATSPEMFEPYYGKGGVDGDGDITKPENLDAFKDFVLRTTGGQGVHTVMADGGFSVEGQENIQEILSKRLYLCQVLCAMNILRPGGSFVCKLFDVFTPFSVGLMYLLWRSFDEVCLHKPHTSRPANSERYVICKRMRDDVNAVRDHLTRANLEYARLVEEGRLNNEDIEELVPLALLKEKEEFCNYIVNSNEKLAERQTLYLQKYKAYARNPMLQDSRQEQLRQECMRYWKVPDEKRPQAPRPNPSNRMEELCRNYQSWISGGQPAAFDAESLNSVNAHEYRVVLRTAKPAIFLALGKRYIFHYEGTRWETVDNPKLSIPRDTILFAELTSAIKGEGKSQILTPILRVFDAYCLGGEHVADKAFRERRRLVVKFCQAIRKESRTDLAPICPADVWHVEQVPSFNDNFVMGKIRGGAKPMFRCPQNGTCQIKDFVRCDADLYLPAQGFIIHRILTDDWKLAFSKREHRLYFFNVKTRESVFEGRQDAFCDFITMHAGRRVWPGPRRKRGSGEDGDARMDPEEELLLDLKRFGEPLVASKRERSESRSDSS